MFTRFNILFSTRLTNNLANNRASILSRVKNNQLKKTSNVIHNKNYLAAQCLTRSNFDNFKFSQRLTNVDTILDKCCKKLK